MARLEIHCTHFTEAVLGHFPCQLCVKKLVKRTESRVTPCDLTRNVASLLLHYMYFFEAILIIFFVVNFASKKSLNALIPELFDSVLTRKLGQQAKWYTVYIIFFLTWHYVFLSLTSILEIQTFRSLS